MKARLLAALAGHGQEHLLAFSDELTADEQAALAAEINGIDFAQVARLYHAAKSQEDWTALAARATGPPAIRLGRRDNPFSAAQACRRGEAALRSGHVGVVLVAGGQGTRLGCDEPKGMYRIGPVSGASLFQILFEKVIAVGRRYGVRLPMAVMTSPATHDETLDYLAKHDRFGMPEDDLYIFCQGRMPAVDAETGRVLLAEKGRIALSPDGHGGMLAALKKSGTLDILLRRRVEQFFYMQVDNPLVGVCDPEFIGYHLLAASELSTQVVAKIDWRERVGVVVSVDGHVRLIEYSDLPESAARRTRPDGTLELWAGSIAVHVFDMAFIARRAADGSGLPFHLARKAVPYLDAIGNLIQPCEPNAIKFEQFIFDLLPEARNPIVVEVDAARAFAPVKNAPGAECDTPESVRRQMIALHTEWLRAAGADVAENVPVEISPLFALDKQECAAKIKPGLRVRKPTYFAEGGTMNDER